MQEQVNYGQHVVAMIDLLGQSKMYSGLEAFQREHPPGTVEFREKLIEFIRAIDGFKDSVDAFLNIRRNPETPANLPEEAKEFYEKAKSEITKVQRFSDGIMAYVPLMDNDNAIPITSVMTILSCLGSTMLVQFAKGNPIRAGIGLGGAAEIDEGELFGPAIGYAHEMESKKAIFPRAAVHPNVIEYLNSFDELEDDKSHEGSYKYEMAKLCKSMIVRDKDGVFILDFLGEALWDYVFQGGDQELVNLAFEFIKEQKDLYHKEKKIFKKYKYSYNYFIDSGRVNA